MGAEYLNCGRLLNRKKRKVWDWGWQALNLSIVPKETVMVEHQPPALKILTEGESALTIHVM